MKINLILIEEVKEVIDEVIRGLRGRQLPPPGTAYRKYFDQCGVPKCVRVCLYI